jgi:L-fuconolactonase
MEGAIEPELPISDAHHHLWYDPLYDSPYFVEDFVADANRGHNIVRSVFVECGDSYRTEGPDFLKSVGETERIARLAPRSTALGGPTIAGIVASVDLRLGDSLDEAIDMHALAAAGSLRGVRVRVGYDPTGTVPAGYGERYIPDQLADERFRAGVRTLGQRGLSLDVFAYHLQLQDVLGLARAVPNTTIVINHLGCPLGVGSYGAGDHQTEVLRIWRGSITELSSTSNVVIKLGGLGMRRIIYEWPETPAVSSNDIAYIMSDTVRFVIDTFGPNRCMFESNFPVDRQSFDYVTIWNAFKKMTLKYAPAERESLFQGTADLTYNLLG